MTMTSATMQTIMGATYEKARENRLRRIAKRQGYLLMKCRFRNPEALEYGRFWIIDPLANAIVSGFGGWNHTASLDDIEGFLLDDAS